MARRRRLREVQELRPDVVPTLRLAPDQLALARQVQIACDTVKLGHSYLTGKPAQPQEDNETTLAELQTRVRSIITLLDALWIASEERGRHTTPATS